MKASIWTDYFEKLSPEDGILALREAGFSYGEFAIEHSLALQARSADVEKTGLAFRALLEDTGFSLPQGHLDFQKDLTAPETVDALKKEITMFQAIGIRNAVIHIGGGLELPEEVRREKQLAHMRELLEFVQGTDFTFCIENLRQPNTTVADADGILHWIDELGGKNLGICLDTGHLHYSKQTLGLTDQTHKEFITKAGKYLKALHIHENNGTGDLHLAPYATIRNGVGWGEVMTALHEIGYDGLFNLEVSGESESCPHLYILKRKLLYLKDLVDYMISENFHE